MQDDHLLYDVKDHIAYFTINRQQQRNAISVSALALFHAYLDQAENDGNVRVLCITGAGDKAFCSGADLAGNIGNNASAALAAFKSYARLLKRLSGFSKPTVARVNGACIAGGTGFMLACDIVIASSKATFGTPEVNVGLFPMMIGALIFKNVLRKKAMEMVLLGEKITASQALDMGLITRMVEPEKLDTAVNEILTALAAKSPIGMKIGKNAFYTASDMPFEQALDFLADKLAEVASTQDAVEGITAFLEKRPPVFVGK